MRGRLSKSERVLDLSDVDPYRAIYAQVEEETLRDIVVVQVPAEVYRDLGRPDQITVTIEPGDTLNPKEDS